MVSAPASVPCNIAKLVSTKANGKKTCEMVVAWSDILMETDTKANSEMGNRTEKVSTHGQMAKSMKENG